MPRAARESDAWLCHVSLVGGARRRGCAAGGVPVFISGLLDENRLVVLGVVHDELTGRTPPARLERRATRVMAMGVAAAPVREEPKRAGELASGLGELVLKARRAVLVGPGDDQCVLLERLQ